MLLVAVPQTPVRVAEVDVVELVKLPVVRWSARPAAPTAHTSVAEAPHTANRLSVVLVVIVVKLVPSQRRIRPHRRRCSNR